MQIKQLTPEESWEIFNKLPDSIQDIIDSKESGEINKEIIEKFDLTGDQIDIVFNLFFLVYGRGVSMSEFYNALKEKINLDDQTTRQLALEISQKRFWPIRDYIGGVEKLIKTLGGELPKKIIKPIAEQESHKKTAPQNDSFDKNSSSEQKADNIVQKNIKAALTENPNVEEQIITAQSILLTNSGEIHKSSIKYWLLEYMQTLGAGYHSNLDRIGFLYNNANAKKLSAEERLVLGAVLKSYDDGDNLPFSETTGRLMVDKLKQ